VRRVEGSSPELILDLFYKRTYDLGESQSLSDSLQIAAWVYFRNSHSGIQFKDSGDALLKLASEHHPPGLMRW